MTKARAAPLVALLALSLVSPASSARAEGSEPTGGVLVQRTFGLKWHLTPNARIVVNDGNARLHGVGHADLLGVRCQVGL